jgi:hypothetical protein
MAEAVLPSNALAARRSGPLGSDASSTPRPLVRSTGATCSAPSMRGHGATLRGSTCASGSANRACRNGAPSAVRAAPRRAPSIHNRTEAAHSIAPT